MPTNRSHFAKATVLAAAAAAALLAAGPASADAALSVTPAGGLSDGQSVNVTGSGYTAGTQVSITECSTATVCSGTAVTAEVAADGTFTASYPVQKSFTGRDWSTGADVTVDCATAQCQISAWEQGTGTLTQSITFG